MLALTQDRQLGQLICIAHCSGCLRLLLGHRLKPCLSDCWVPGMVTIGSGSAHRIAELLLRLQ